MAQGVGVVGIFIARGPHIRPGAQIDRVRIIDVAATTLYALGLPVPHDMEGRVIAEAFRDDHLAADPPRIDWTASDGRIDDPQEETAPQDDPEILTRLKALGYIE